MTKVISFKELTRENICKKVQDFLNTLTSEHQKSAVVSFQVIVTHGPTLITPDGKFVHFAYIAYQE